MKMQQVFKRDGAINVFDKLVDQESRPEAETATADAEDQPADDAVVESAADDDAAAETGEQNDESESEIDETAGQASNPLRGRRFLRRLIVATASVLLVAALGLAAFLGWQLKQQDDTAAAAQAALTVAKDYAVTLTSIDSSSIDQNFAQVLDGASGEFKDMYSQSATSLRQMLIDNKAVSKGVVVDAAVKSATKTKVEVLLFIDQSISNSVVPGPRLDRSRVAMTMELVDGHWLASKVDIR